ncbi:uncharacterized protein LOC110857680 [Folsomia candida]|uniref:Uncharacterized protein n=1 Tax=Folsomia candida TaxID=158441 RepID=A0A226DH58_FOLCA|nr:uncharacterized protein LOC110857680 [Folsomia candida]XP_021961977.1 uncharacterized protein LOC110857680 [Folsomia candida]OXA44480.1 hypothetical protein Fcan01_20861 [Folsomia candida]
MEPIFTFHQANFVGRLETTFLAEVCGIEEKLAQTPYLRVMLTQDDGDTIMVAMAIGKAYHVAKNLYEVGKVYCFPRGMFKIRQRNVAIQSWSSYPFDLRFLNNSNKNESLKVSCPPTENQVQSVVSSHHSSMNADTDNDWKGRSRA